MSANFDWQTESESEWGNVPDGRERPSPPIRQRFWFWPVVVLGFAALLAGLILFWQVRRRATAVTQSIEQDITTSFELMTTAVDQGDLDLFQSLHLQNGRHTGWGRSLDTLVSQDRQFWYGRRPGFTLLTKELQPADIVIAPDLKSAQLVAAQPYEIQTTSQGSQTIILQQIYTFELADDGRWLLAAPDDDFWGEWLTYDSQRFNLSYPARDEVLSLRIATALDKNLTQFCDWSVDLPTLPPCPNDLQFQVRWRQEIGSLAQLEQTRADSVFSVDSGDNPIITMPAPTLVGTPTDAAGEQIVVDLLVRQTMAIIFRSAFLGSEDFSLYRFAEYNQASLNQLLVQMEVAAWPPPNLPLDELGLPPIPWPEQAITLTCLDEAGQQAAIYHLHPENGDWSTVFAADDLVGVQFWPGGRALVQNLQGLTTSWAIVEPDGTAVPVPLPDEPVDYLYRYGRYLIAPVRPQKDFAPWTAFFALEWEPCLQGECLWHDLPGYPIFSPDESELLFGSWLPSEPNGQIYFGQGLEGPFEVIAEGTNPVWLDNSRFSYMHYDPLEGGQERLMVTHLDGGETAVLLEVADLDEFFPRKFENHGFSIQQADTRFSIHLADIEPNLLLIHVHRYQTISTSLDLPANNYLLLYDLSTGTKTVMAEGVSLQGMFGGNGRYLIISRYDAEDYSWSVERYDIVQQENETLFEHTWSQTNLALSPVRGPTWDWTEDEEWLLFFQEGLLILLAPDYNYQKVIAPETPGCFNAAWVR